MRFEASASEAAVGDRVLVLKEHEGVVRFVGQTKFKATRCDLIFGANSQLRQLAEGRQGPRVSGEQKSESRQR